jgi:hypothetical protein
MVWWIKKNCPVIITTQFWIEALHTGWTQENVIENDCYPKLFQNSYIWKLKAGSLTRQHYEPLTLTCCGLCFEVWSIWPAWPLGTPAVLRLVISTEVFQLHVKFEHNGGLVFLLLLLLLLLLFVLFFIYYDYCYSYYYSYSSSSSSSQHCFVWVKENLHSRLFPTIFLSQFLSKSFFPSCWS